MNQNEYRNDPAFKLSSEARKMLRQKLRLEYELYNYLVARLRRQKMSLNAKTNKDLT